MKDTAEVGKDLIVTRSWSRKSKEEKAVDNASVDLWLCGHGIGTTVSLTPEGAEKLAGELKEQARLVREMVGE